MPTRLLFDLGGMVGEDGTAVIGGGAGASEPTSSYVQAKLTAALSTGTAAWQVEIVRAIGSGGSLISSAQGAGVETSFILAPGEHVQASLTGGTPGASVRGSVMGTQAHPAGNLPPLYHGGSVTVLQPAPPTTPPTTGAAGSGLVVAIPRTLGQRVVVDSVEHVQGVTVVVYHHES